MTVHLRHKLIIFLALMSIGVMLISTSLPGLRLQGGLPIPGAVSNQNPASEAIPPLPAAVVIADVFQYLLAFTFLFFLTLLLLHLGKVIKFNQVYRFIGGLLVVVLLMILVNQIHFTNQISSSAGSSKISPYPSTIYDVAPIGDPPVMIYDFVTILLFICVAIIFFWILIQIIQRFQNTDSLAGEAETALQAIKKGGDLRSIIIRCYAQMERIAREKRGLQRREYATPREFELLLASSGIPDAPVHQLTNLFEKVRYGSKELDKKDEQTAVECLSAIRKACEGKKRGLP